MSATFPKCGHPLTPENTRRVGPRNNSKPSCRFCFRMRQIVRSVERAQARINAGGYTLGERIASGVIA